MKIIFVNEIYDPVFVSANKIGSRVDQFDETRLFIVGIRNDSLQQPLVVVSLLSETIEKWIFINFPFLPQSRFHNKMG